MTVKQKNRMLKVDNRFITTLGINPAILLSELLDKEQFCIEEKNIDNEGYFYHEKNHIFKRTGLKRSKFDTARAILEEKKILKTKIGAGKKIFFKIDDAEYSRFIFPKSQSIIPRSTIHEELTKEGYFMYNIWLAHEIGINETIFLTDLISKRNYFETRWDLINGFFFNSISSVQKTTSLWRKQQDRCIKNLVESKLIHTKLIDWNTRYFCLNDTKIEECKQKNYIEFEAESWKGTGSESWKRTGIDLGENPFCEYESWKGTAPESRKETGSESWKETGQKAGLNQGWKLKSAKQESWNSTPNNNKTNTTKEKEINKYNKQESMLVSYFNLNIPHEKKVFDNLCSKYSAARIREVIQRIKPSTKNPTWFIIEALEKNYFTSSLDLKNKIEEQKIIESNKQKQRNKESREINSRKQRIIEWKEKNPEAHKELQEKIEKEVLEHSSWEFDINIRTAIIIQVNQYIQNHFLE